MDGFLLLSIACKLAHCSPSIGRHAICRGWVVGTILDGDYFIAVSNLHILRELGIRRRAQDRRRRAPQLEGAKLRFVIKEWSSATNQGSRKDLKNSNSGRFINERLRR